VGRTRNGQADRLTRDGRLRPRLGKKTAPTIIRGRLRGRRIWWLAFRIRLRSALNLGLLRPRPPPWRTASQNSRVAGDRSRQRTRHWGCCACTIFISARMSRRGSRGGIFSQRARLDRGSVRRAKRPQGGALRVQDHADFESSFQLAALLCQTLSGTVLPKKNTCSAGPRS